MKIHWPKIPIPEGFDNAESYLRHLVYEGAKKRYMDKDDDFVEFINERIEQELDYLKGYEPYFILFYDLARFCRSEHIMYRIAWGYAISSMVNYCLGITDVASIYDTFIERFFLKEEFRYPDINLLVDDTKRDDIVKYLKTTYGDDHVLEAGVGYLPNEDRGNGKRVPVYAIHAFRICIFDKPYCEITDTIEMEHERTGQKIIVPKLTCPEIESLGYICIDIAPIESLTHVSQTLQLIEENKGKRIDYNSIPLDDPATFDYLTSGNEEIRKMWFNKALYDIFSYVKPRNIDDLTTIQTLAHHRKWDDIILLKDLIEEDDRDCSITLFYEYFESSHGLLVYQEQIILILSLMSNLNLTECEKIRRLMQYPDYMPIKDIFLKSVNEYGLYEIEEAEEIWCYFMRHHKKTSSYAHFYNITVDYFRRTWLRVHYPEEFEKCYLCKV